MPKAASVPNIWKIGRLFERNALTKPNQFTAKPESENLVDSETWLISQREWLLSKAFLLFRYQTFTNLS